MKKPNSKKKKTITTKEVVTYDKLLEYHRTMVEPTLNHKLLEYHRTMVEPALNQLKEDVKEIIQVEIRNFRA